jgi:hypothetical protein
MNFMGRITRASIRVFIELESWNFTERSALVSTLSTETSSEINYIGDECWRRKMNPASNLTASYTWQCELDSIIVAVRSIFSIL